MVIVVRNVVFGKSLGESGNNFGSGSFGKFAEFS
jgi:hypothetical protein